MAQWNGVSGKQVLITGATNGIGLAAAKALAGLGAKLAIVARNGDKAQAAVASIKAVRSDAVVDLFMADLSSQASVRRLAAEVLARYSKLDVLINNAGAMYTKRRLTEDGIELTWALNHLAPFLLTNLLLDRLKESSPAHIITTASDAHRHRQIPFDDLSGERSYRGFNRYGQTKLANILFTKELARRLQDTGVTANCFHPGLVATGINWNNGRWMNVVMTVLRLFSRTPEKGAETLGWLADSPEVSEMSGGYFVDKRRAMPTEAAEDIMSAQRLWEISEQQVGGLGAGAGG